VSFPSISFCFGLPLLTLVLVVVPPPRSPRRWNKLITSDRREAVENMSRSRAEYEFLVNYCDRHHVTQCFVEEREICRQMKDLLQIKIDAIMHGAPLA